MRSTHHIRNRMRWLMISIGLICGFALSAQPNINKIEYFFDTDPGFGSGTNVTVSTPAPNISSLNFSVGLSSISPGFHTLYVRSRTANGKWSLTNGSNIIKYQAQSATLGATTKINKVEYFFDTDPGFGNGTNIPVTASTDISSLSVPVNVSTLSGGFHVLYIRSRDSLGRWSLTNNSNFLRYQPQPYTLGPTVKVTKMEYFIDNDPGFGNGINIPVVAANDINGQAVSVNISSLASGYHTIYLRSCDSLGRWSLTNNSSFVKYLPQTATLGPVTKINKMEYFFDNDPGFGNAINIPVTASTDINNLSLPINISSLSGGVHTLFIRSRDSLGRWSITNNGTFVKYQPQTASLGPLVKIMRLEYFIDVDPGVGAATPVAITPILNLNNYAFVANLATVSNGTHRLYVRSIDSLGRWSITNYGSFTGGTLQPPTATITVVGTQPLCSGTGYLRVNKDASPIATYQWKLNGNPVPGATDTIFYPTTSGTYTVFVSNTAGSITSNPVSVTVNPAPTATIAANGPLSFCGGSSVLLSVNQSTGATYQWKINGSNIGGANSYTYTATSTGVYQVVVTGTNGCSTLSAKDTITVTPAVTPSITITANQTTICTGTTDSFFATINNGGSTPLYQWMKNGVIVGTNSPVYVSSSLSNNDTIYCVLTSNAVCASPASLTSNKIVIIVSSVSAPSVSISASQNSICAGASVTFTASPTNGGANPSYQWLENGITQGATGYQFTTSSINNGDSVWCILTSNSACASTPNATSNKVRVVVNPTVTPSVSISVTRNSICAASVDTFTASPVNGGSSPTYQWYRNGVLQIISGATYITSSLSNNDSVWCIMISSAACPSPASVTSNHIRVSVTSTVTPTITVSASQTTICTGDSVTFTAATTNGGPSPSYQWFRNGVAVGNNSGIYGSRNLADNDSVWCILTSNATCASPSTASSNRVRITVNQVTAPSVSVSASQTSICTGVSITFTAAPINGGSSPSYQWYKNGILQSGTTGTFSTSALSTNDSVWCIMTSNSACASVPTATSNKIYITVLPTVTPSVTISATQISICSGSNITFTASAINGGNNPSYQWYRNGVLQSGNIATFSSTVLANNDSVWCIMTSNAACASSSTATSNKIKITVNSYVTPTIIVSAVPTSICAGDSVRYTASITNSGSNPIYQWKKNGVTVGSNNSTFTDALIASTDSVWCVLTSNIACPTTASATSNKVRITVNSIVVPTITVSASQTTICNGNTVNFTQTNTNAGATPAYQWYKNGALVSTSSFYNDNALANNDSIWCVLTSSNSCASPTTATSNKVVITITSAVVPSVTVTTAQTTICAGTGNVTFTAHPVNGGNSPIYQWYKNGVLQAGNLVTFSTSIANNDSVWCVMTSNASCVSPTTATSNKVVMTVNVGVTPTISISASLSSICAGDSVTFIATISNGGSNPIYQWRKNGVTVGSNTAQYGTRGLLAGDSVWCILTSNATCASPASVSSNKAHVTVNPIVTPSISVSASQTTVCVGSAVIFTASITNGGSNPTYQWYKNGNPVGVNASTYRDSILSNSDSVWCIHTSTAVCATTNIASSNHVVITITGTVVPRVINTTPLIQVCAGSTVTFRGTTTNGGTNPIIHWYRNGALQDSMGITYTVFNLATPDTVYCTMTSNAQCASPATVISDTLVMSIIQPSYFTYSATVCAGDSFNFRGRQVSQIGLYTDTLTSVTGCDSIILFTLNNYAQPLQVINASICPGDSFDFRGVQIYQSGIYADTLTNAGLNGCDSIIRLVLSTRSILRDTQYVTICNGHLYAFGGSILNNAGTYADTLTGINGCDSISTLILSISAPISTSISGSTCQGYAYYFNGRPLTTAGIYTDTVQSARGCDSIIHLTLSVKSNARDSINAAICQGNLYSFHGRSLTQTGIYRDTLTSANGCDSVVTVNLTVYPKPSPIANLYGGDTLRTSGYSSYQWLFNNTIISGAAGQTYIATRNGYYRVIVFNANGCSDTSQAVQVAHLGIGEEVVIDDLHIYPNPTENVIHIDADRIHENSIIELVDALGKQIYTSPVNSGSIHEQLDLSPYASGLYILVIKDSERVYVSHRIIKN